MTITAQKTNSEDQCRVLSASDLDQVSGGAAWFPIIVALARFGLSRASHNGGGGKVLVPELDLPPSQEDVGIRSSTPA